MVWKNDNLYQSLPEVPKFSIPKIRKQQARYIAWLLEDMTAFGEVFQNRILEGLRRRILRELPDRCVAGENSEANYERVKSTVDDFLQSLLGRMIDNGFVEELSLRLVEWIPRFQNAEYFEAWDQCKDLWALVYVLDIERVLTKEGRHYVCRFQAIGGLAAGTSWDTRMSGGQIQHLLREIGFPKYSKYPDHEVGGMYMVAYLRPDSRRINIGEVTATSSVLTHNKKLFKQRQDICKSGFWNGICINCPWGRKDCKLARHQHTYEEMVLCSNFRIADGKKKFHKGYKVRRDQGVCLDCLNKGHIRPEALQAYYQKKKKFKEGTSMLGEKKK